MNGEIVPTDKINTILEAIRLSASAFGLQPYEIFVITDTVLKKKIFDTACDQAPVIESSHLLVFAPYNSINSSIIDRHLKNIAETRNIPMDKLAGFSHLLKSATGSFTAEATKAWTEKQAYIALGSGIIAAAAEKVDALPIEGFNPSKLDELLGLNEKNMHSAVLLALGYRDAKNDTYGKLKKVRKSTQELYHFL